MLTRWELTKKLWNSWVCTMNSMQVKDKLKNIIKAKGIDFDIILKYIENILNTIEPVTV